MKFDTRLLVKKLKQKQLTVAFAESVTGGIATQRLTNCKGASDVLAGSVICYTPEVKRTLLGIPKKTIDQYTCESEQVTEGLISGLEKLIEADIYVAVTGLASEGGSDTPQKPVGTIFVAIKYQNFIHNYRSVFKGSPLRIKEAAVASLYKRIMTILNGPSIEKN
jgi:nicotinamide-nucleotide amidase